jgi:hypothetical protein
MSKSRVGCPRSRQRSPHSHPGSTGLRPVAAPWGNSCTKTHIEAHVHRVWCMLKEQYEGFRGATGRILRMAEWDALAQAGETAAGRGHLTFAE